MPTKHPTREQRRKWNLATRYKITEPAYRAMLEAQFGACAICGKAPTRPCVDHSHDSGATRGILCHKCNVGLPYVEDAAYREAALRYLAQHEVPVPVQRDRGCVGGVAADGVDVPGAR